MEDLGEPEVARELDPARAGAEPRLDAEVRRGGDSSEDQEQDECDERHAELRRRARQDARQSERQSPPDPVGRRLPGAELVEQPCKQHVGELGPRRDRAVEPGEDDSDGVSRAHAEPSV
jgi:hypothetical protein